MSEINCASCSELRENAPDFIANGVTETIAESLANNTGLNPNLDVLHDDCTDLDLANDCLIGFMPKEIEGYDNCDWKDFSKKFLGNLYELLKAMIASECGQWERLEGMCSLMSASLTPPTLSYGVLPNKTSAYNVGSIASSRVTMVSGISYADQGVGIRFARLDVKSCSGSGTTVYEWAEPNLYEARIASGVADGKVLWYATKSAFQAATGASDYFWNRYKSQPFTWYNNIIWEGTSAKKYVGLEIKVNPDSMGDDYIGVVYRGTSYPDDGTTSYAVLSGPVMYSPRLSVHNE